MADVTLLGTNAPTSTVAAAGWIRMTRYQAVKSGTLKNITIKTNNTGGSNWRVGIYVDNAGTPTTLLAQSASTAIETGTNVTPISISDITIVKDTYYWLAMQGDAGNAYVDTSAGTTKGKLYTYGAFPNPAGTGYSSYARTMYLIGIGEEAAAGGRMCQVIII